MSGLYIHIPFCERKCDYCAFYSFSKPWKKPDEFFQTLEKELSDLPSDFSAETIFIGGGTPTAPDFQTLEFFLDRVFNSSNAATHPGLRPPLQRRGAFKIPSTGGVPERRGGFPDLLCNNLSTSGVIEFSVEANPGTIDAEKLALLKRSGVNRLSIGVQSFNSQCLETLGRIHSAEQAEEAFRLARAAGFENISIDLIFGVPGQTLAILEADLERAVALGPEHISIYNLMVEEGTPLAERNPIRLNEELEREMYDRIRARLKRAGFEHYEISNFAKPGFECQHNLLYWTGGEYIGCGPSAHSHWKGTRWANAANIEDWSEREFEETLDEEAKARETLVMGLRLIQGVEVSSNVWKKQAAVFQTLEKQGLLIIEGHHVRLSDDALFVSDAVFTELV